MHALATARREIDRQLENPRGRERIVRQDEVTAEIIELASGALSARRKRSEEQVPTPPQRSRLGNCPKSIRRQDPAAPVL
jgi:hypothetical protein